MNEKKQFEVRDLRQKEQYITDDIFLNGYARFLGIYAIGVYGSLCRHANKEQKSWPSIKKICEELDIGRNSVITSIKKLEFWNIINKNRTGKKSTNRYWLIHKREWKIISEVYLKDYSEVCHINFIGLRDKLHRFTTQTSIVRRHIEGVKEKEYVEQSSPVVKYSSKDLELSTLLQELILNNTPTFKVQSLDKWADHVRLMREQDNRTEEQIEALINWSQQDGFWKANILSTKKLREKFDQLVSQAKRGGGGETNKGRGLA